MFTGLGTGAPIIESPYGDSVQPEEAPESISRAVASLPPEQMFELMKQMKVYWFTAAGFLQATILSPACAEPFLDVMYCSSYNY